MCQCVNLLTDTKMNLGNRHNNIYLENGVHITHANTNSRETQLHYTRMLRTKYKINILILRSGWTHEIFETFYYPDIKQVVVIDYNFKLLEPSVKCTNSLKYCGKEQVYDYYVKYIDTNLITKNIKWN